MVLEILVVDIETANIDCTKDTWALENSIICEIGIAKLNLDSGEINPIFNEICREDNPPDPESWIFEKSSLTCEMIAESTHFKELKGKLQDILNSKPVTSWNHKFDFAHLEYSSRCLAIPTKFWDPEVALTGFLKIPFNSGSGYKWPKVTDAIEYFYPKKSLEQNHRALDDAIIEADIIFQAVEKWPILKNEWKRFV